MKRLLFASMHKKDNKLAWSGTNYHIYNTLCNNYNVSYVYVHSFFASFFRRVFKILNLDYLSELLFSYFISKKFDNLMSSYNEEYVICICASEFLAFSNSNKKVIYISDATYHLMFGYYIKKTNRILVNLYNNIEKKSLDKAYKVVYSSNWAKNDAINYYKIEASKIILLKFGANIISDKKSNMRVIERVVNLLFVGVEFDRKGLDVAMNATNYLNHNDNKHKYVLNVVGINRNDIDKNIDKLLNKDYDKYCIIHDKLYKNNSNDLDKIINLYLNSNLFILPTHAECSAIVYSESSMFGLPAITRDTGGVKDYVENDVNGYALSDKSNYIDFAKKILEIVNHPEIYKELQLNSIKKYENELNWERWLEKFDKIVKGNV